MDVLERCVLCPRKCGINRKKGQTGYCGMSADIKIARASLHMWEEPCISGENGSGTVFFTGCPLKCVFCQNRNIAIGTTGKVISVERLAEIFLELQDKKAHNINLVTPTHFVPQIVEALSIAKREGLRIPIVYNTGSYETVETLKLYIFRIVNILIVNWQKSIRMHRIILKWQILRLQRWLGRWENRSLRET